MLEEILPVVWLSLKVAGAAVLLSSVIGLPLGTWLGLARFPGQRLVSAVIYTGMALPPVVIGLLVYMLLSRSGPLASWGWLFTPKAMILAQIVLDLPFVIGITMAAVASVPPELYLQLRSLGATPRQARRTMLVEAGPGVILALATAFGRSMSEVGAVWMVGGNIQGHSRVLTTAIMLETSKGQFTLALVLGAVLLSFALLVNVAILRFQRQPLP
jgi:tungstate transport system permease protein